MAADPSDVAATKLLRAQFAKFGVDTTMADLRVTHGVAQVRGSLRAYKGTEASNGDLKSTVDNLCKGLRGKPGIKDIVLEVSYRS